MRLLILGYSSIVRRRVLPAARLVPGIESIAVASRSHGEQSPVEQSPAERSQGAGAAARGGPSDDERITWFADYDEALAASGADAVYVSGINTEHARWAMRALDRGLHVMVDKPAFLDLDSAEAAVALARRRGCGLAEATVFAFHPQVDALQALLPAAERPTARVSAVFSIPPLPASDFRYRAGCGGGSLYDQGVYAAAVNRLVFGTAPTQVECRVLTTADRATDGVPAAVDTSFSVLLTHEQGGALTGHFGFITAYQNRLAVLTASRSIDVERFFTTPPDATCTLRVREDNRDRSVTASPGDAFALFLQAFTAATARGDVAAFESALLEDARLMQRLRLSAHEHERRR